MQHELVQAHGAVVAARREQLGRAAGGARHEGDRLDGGGRAHLRQRAVAKAPQVPQQHGALAVRRREQRRRLRERGGEGEARRARACSPSAASTCSDRASTSRTVPSESAADSRRPLAAKPKT